MIQQTMHILHPLEDEVCWSIIPKVKIMLIIFFEITVVLLKCTCQSICHTWTACFRESTAQCEFHLLMVLKYTLPHDQDTIHAEKGGVEMCDYCIATLMFLTGHGIAARTHAHVEIGHFITRCFIRAWEAWGQRLSASQALMMHFIGKCPISKWAWFLAIF